MNKAMRMLTLVGMGLMASATIGATPALAADAAGQTAAKKPVVKVQQHRDNDWVAGYYRTARACERAGWVGERFNKWDDYDCERVRYGFRRGMWALEVERDRNWFRPGHGNGPGRPGHHGPGRPGHHGGGFGHGR
jgi:hypothetical protein